MAKYSGIHSCGHEGIVNVIGKQKDRQWKIDRHFNNICEECRKEEFNKSNLEALKEAKKMELPELKGSEKQVLWANKIRIEILENLEKVNLHEIAEFLMINKTSAYWWIDARHGIDKEELENEMKKEKLKEEEKLLEDDDKEYTVFPKEIKHNVPVKIITVDNEIKIYFERNENFINIVKNMKYKWLDGNWGRTIREKNGELKDRVAEIGNKLLKEGFGIIIYDKKCLENAINGTYEEECTRWIMHRIDSDKLVIKWEGYNNTLYNTAKTLSGAKWDNGILVNARHYNEIEDFANRENFKFSEYALKLIEKYKNEDINIIAPQHKKEEIEKDKKETFEVLDDLKD